MALTRREHNPLVWRNDMLRRLFDSDWNDGGLLRIEEFRDGDKLVVRAEIPDIDPAKNVEVTVQDEVLHVRAERQEKSETTKKDRYRSEFRYGSFERAIPLPPGVDPEAVEATYADGVLTVQVPLPAQKPDSTRVIPVQSAKS